jgi:hypothetical protein
MKNYQTCHCEALAVAGVRGSRSNLIAMHGDEVASSPSHANPFAPRNDMFFICRFITLRIVEFYNPE